MTKRLAGVAVLYCALVLGLGACGDDGTGGVAGSGGAGGDAGSGDAGGSSGTGGGAALICPMIAASWVVEEHCVEGFVGETIPFTQIECSLVVGGAFSGLEGTVGADGEVDLFGALGVMPYACEGVATATEMTLTCTDDCPVRLVVE